MQIPSEKLNEKLKSLIFSLARENKEIYNIRDLNIVGTTINDLTDHCYICEKELKSETKISVKKCHGSSYKASNITFPNSKALYIRKIGKKTGQDYKLICDKCYFKYQY